MSAFVVPHHLVVKQPEHWLENYRLDQSLYTPGVGNSDYDGAELTLFVWRELCESPHPPQVHGPSIPEAVTMLNQRFVHESQK